MSWPTNWQPAVCAEAIDGPSAKTHLLSGYCEIHSQNMSVSTEQMQ